MEWISVEDRLPEPNKPYINVDGHRVVNATKELIVCGHDNGVWVDYFDDEDLNEERLLELGVTHWMPLPEPPKQ